MHFRNQNSLHLHNIPFTFDGTLLIITKEKSQILTKKYNTIITIGPRERGRERERENLFAKPT